MIVTLEPPRGDSVALIVLRTGMPAPDGPPLDCNPAFCQLANAVLSAGMISGDCANTLEKPDCLMYCIYAAGLPNVRNSTLPGP